MYNIGITGNKYGKSDVKFLHGIVPFKWQNGE